MGEADRQRKLETGRPVLFFVTTSDVKYQQYEVIFDDLGFELRRADFHPSLLIEPQIEASDPESALRVVSHPLDLLADLMSKKNQVPFFLEDTMLFIDEFSKEPGGFSGLPGADTKNWWYNLGAKGVLQLLNGTPNRSARFTCQIGVYFGPDLRHFERYDLAGRIADSVKISPRAEEDFPKSNPHFFHSIFEPSGCGMTLAEMAGMEFPNYDYRRHCAKKLVSKLREMTSSLCAHYAMSV
jgi:inosine/xanthosine triphosphate pyrophosphatase family protein